MFGYIKPNIPEMKVRENELYKATYCGLCRAMGKHTGGMSRFTLSYDFAFFALLRMVLENVKGEIEMRKCMVHPFKKRPMLRINDTLKYTASTSVILTRLKLKDNINDSKGILRIKAKIVGLVSVFFKKTDKSLLELEGKIKGYIEELSSLEKESCDSIDRVAIVFGKLLGAIASYGLEDSNSKIAYEIGFHLGKWIYVIDACDDFYDDIKTGSYNVLKNAFGDTLTDDDKSTLKCAMMLELDTMSKGIELIDFSRHRDVEGVIRNIVFDGMIKETERILSREKSKK